MKSYFDCLNEITEPELFEGLLGCGMFNHKLPPVFSSAGFYDYCISKPTDFSKKAKDWIRFDNNRNNHLPRRLGIPNPFAYFYLCDSLKSNWKELLKYFRDVTGGQPYKVSRCHIRKKKSTKRLFEMNYDNHSVDGPKEPVDIVSSKFVVETDISSCFDSIYTHCIPWAILGKPLAKEKHQKHVEHFTNDLDVLVSSTTYGETHGLLIGPDSSSLISEIILTRIDEELLNKKYKFVRFIDDYKCYVQSVEQGKRFIVDLRKALLNYDLAINEKKTAIIPALTVESKDLRIKVRQLDYLIDCRSEIGKKIKYKEIVEYFNALDRVCVELDNNLSVYLFAFKILSTKDLTINASKYLVNKAQRLAFNYPYLLFSLQSCIFDKFGVTPDIKLFCEDLYSDGVSEANFEKAVYSMYFSIVNGVKMDFLEDRFIKDAKNNDDCLLKLFSWLYSKAYYGAKFEKEFHNLALELSKDASEFDRNWLFVYECLGEAELPPGDWKRIKKAKVSFIDNGALLPRSNWRTPLY